MDITSENNEINNKDDVLLYKKEQKSHHLKHSSGKFKTLSQKYNTLNSNNEAIENNKLYKVDKYQINVEIQ